VCPAVPLVFSRHAHRVAAVGGLERRDVALGAGPDVGRRGEADLVAPADRRRAVADGDRAPSNQNAISSASTNALASASGAASSGTAKVLADETIGNASQTVSAGGIPDGCISPPCPKAASRIVARWRKLWPWLGIVDTGDPGYRRRRPR